MEHDDDDSEVNNWYYKGSRVKKRVFYDQADRKGGADLKPLRRKGFPPPPPYGQPDRKISTFFDESPKGKS